MHGPLVIVRRGVHCSLPSLLLSLSGFLPVATIHMTINLLTLFSNLCCSIKLPEENVLNGLNRNMRKLLKRKRCSLISLG